MASNFIGGPDTVPKPDVPPPNFMEELTQKIASTRASGIIEEILAKIAAAIYAFIEEITVWGVPFITAFVAGYIQLMDRFEGPEGADLRTLQAVMLEDLLDVPIDPAAIIGAQQTGGRVAGMQKLGEALTNVLEAEMTGGMGAGQATGRAAVNRWLGFVMNFAVKQGLQGFVTEAVTFGLFEKGDAMAQAFGEKLGLGRLTRQALRPWIETLVEVPLEMELNEKYRPRLPGAGQAADAYVSGYINGDLYREFLRKQGYPDVWINALVALTQKEVGGADIERLVRFGKLAPADAITRLQRAGYTRGEALLAMEERDLTRRERRLEEYIDTLAALAIDRRIPVEVFLEELRSSPFTAEEQFYWRSKVGVRLDSDQKELSLSQMQNAVKDGILNFVEFEQYLAAERYTPRSREILIAQLRLEMGEIAAKEEARRQAEEERERKAAESAKQKELELARRLEAATNRPLTLSQMREAFLEGDLQEAEYRSYLEREGYGARSAELLLLDAVRDRTELMAKREQAAELQDRAQVRRLSLSEMESAYVGGVVRLEELTQYLAEQGYVDRDIEILLAAAETDRAARLAIDAERAARLAAPRPPALSIEQERALYLGGLIELAELEEFFTREGFTGRELELLLEQSQELKRRADADEAERQRIANQQPARLLSIAQAEAAYTAGDISREDFESRLVGVGYSLRDRQILLASADRDRQAREAREAAASAAAALPPPPRLTVEQETAAYVGGIITRAKLEEFLTREGLAPEERDILLHQADARLRAAIQQREEAARLRALAPPPKLTLAQEQEAFVSGLISEARFVLFLQAEGYNQEETALLLELARRDRGAAIARQQAATAPATPAPPRPLTRSEAKQAFVEGLMDAPAYRAYLLSQGYSSSSAELLLELALRERREREAELAAAAIRAAAPPAPRLTLSQMEAAVLQGIASQAEWAAYLAGEGYSARERQILTEALQLKAARAAAAPGP